MSVLVLQLTDAGLAAVQGASGSDLTVIADLGLSNTPFVAAPTLTALPGEFKRLDIQSGTAASPNVAHLTAYDTSSDVWNATGFGLFLDDGTLFGTYSAEDTVLSKAGLAFALIAFDIGFSADFAANIAFGNALFVYPPATETTRGVAEIATQAEVDAGTDTQRFVTPARLKTLLANTMSTLTTSVTATLTAMTNSIAAFAARSITGGGLATGGGSLAADRVITVTEASDAEITAGTSASSVVTPRRLGPISMLLARTGYIRFFKLQIAWGRFTASANASSSVAFPLAFQNDCASVVVSGVVNGGADSKDNTPAVIASTITTAGFSVFSADDEADVTCYIALGY
ncbi:gp53-like domain-containing protein [Novosphingobium clariflavum]|uniref:Putative tail fiber protein gp53-like C-terminal domain-containing protein n=1 Tax=Novosphingobium clariflavum TaxID=2029884 RepID=A0ABV6S770_9SPHN|nr:hypothetical protein [Novosphingobium clariflavum]